MKLKMLFAVCLAAVPYAAMLSQPQAEDPVVMVVNGQPVPRSEFEYSFNKNNSEGVIDKKSVEEYVDLFINYKLKLFAALDAHYDTLTSYQKEFAMYRDQQVIPMLVTDDDMEAEAHKVYDDAVERIGPDGLIKTAHILIRANQQAPQAEWDAAKMRADSIYNALKAGADFSELATRLSQDPGSARTGGELPFVQRGQLVKEYEDAAYALTDSGQVSGVVKSSFGYHIIQLRGRKMLEPFDFHRADILAFIERQNRRDQIGQQKVEEMMKERGVTQEQFMEEKTRELSKDDLDLRYLIQEYHDGLLVFEISNNMVWKKAADDEEGLKNYFKKHKANYGWDEPRFKGIVFHVKDKNDVKNVKNCVKKLPFTKWDEALKATFGNDSIKRVRVDRGRFFKAGSNAYLDKVVFKKDTVVTPLEDYPVDAHFGKVLKKGPEEYTDVRDLVVSDYQEELEKAWVADLRRRYTFQVNEDVLKTVNNHQ